MKMKSLVSYLVIVTILEFPVNGQVWPWESTGGSLPTPSTNIDGSDGGVITMNYAFDVNNLIPNGIRNWISGGLASIQNDVLNVLGSIGGSNANTQKMLNAFMSTIDQFAQSRGANADTLAAQLNALRQHLLDLSRSQLQSSASAATQSNASLVPSVQALSDNIVTQLQYLESIVSPALPCASEAYAFLKEKARSGAQQTTECLGARYQSIQNNIGYSLRDIRTYLYHYGPDVYGAVRECNNNTGVSLLISNVTKSSACWAQAALQLKSDTINMLYRLTEDVAQGSLYRATAQISLAQCTFSAFDVFSTNSVNAGIQKLFSCAGAWQGSGK